MTEDTSGTIHTDAVERLQKLGLTEYAARVYVALLRLGSGTAREIAETVDVPRTRVYDAVASLQERGFVDVSYNSPKMFRPVSRETATRQFQLEYEETIDDLTTTLAALEPIDSRHEQTGVWTVGGREAITDRVLEFITESTTEVVYMSVEELLTDDIIEALATADDRGAAIQLAGISSASRREIQSEIPSAETFETLWEWLDTTAGRLLMVDRETILVSVLSEEATPEETAIWGSGKHNSLVVVLKAVFTWRINHADRFEDDR
jgi:sugar-specific transcriptional regulator TrmB